MCFPWRCYRCGDFFDIGVTTEQVWHVLQSPMFAQNNNNLNPNVRFEVGAFEAVPPTLSSMDCEKSQGIFHNFKTTRKKRSAQGNKRDFLTIFICTRHFQHFVHALSHLDPRVRRRCARSARCSQGLKPRGQPARGVLLGQGTQWMPSEIWGKIRGSGGGATGAEWSP